jgi:hypothetical protein
MRIDLINVVSLITRFFLRAFLVFSYASYEKLPQGKKENDTSQ